MNHMSINHINHTSESHQINGRPLIHKKEKIDDTFIKKIKIAVISKMSINNNYIIEVDLKYEMCTRKKRRIALYIHIDLKQIYQLKQISKTNINSF